MSYQKRPSISDRAFSTPQMLSINLSAPLRSKEAAAPPVMNLLTPPISPASSRYSRSSTDLSSYGDDYRNDFSRELLAQAREIPELPKSADIRTHDGTLICPYEVVLLTDNQDRNQTFGYGAWSTVFKGTCYPARAYSSGFVTPPPYSYNSPPVLVAVKQPARKDAKPILESEAKILSHLMLESGHDRFVVPFYGMLPSDSSLVMAAMPSSLDDHIRSCATAAKANRTTWNRTQPVIGTERVWLSLAHDLIGALSWLHNEAMIIHGDIKPGNILLGSAGVGVRDESQFPYQPVFCDFSSSQHINSPTPTLGTLSAVTREYTAPELLSSKVLQDPNSTATTASDVFSLAVTLLVAATGNTMVYSGPVYQRQAMATQGWGVIGMVKNSDEGTRIPRQGTVQRVLEKAVLKHNVGRIDAATWEDMVDKMLHGDPSKQDTYNDSRMV